ncbi:DNA replication complex GINS family protein [Candidatus Bathyarchaeota archaeon]|nr:MAG: DNA replication complex GINS family protein [Candidatus Bathyarchaeota archaeon]
MELTFGLVIPRGASKLEREPSIVEIVDTEFENSPSRITLLREFPETRIGDRTLGPYRMGQEVELSLWTAQHLVQMGYARFKDEEQLTLNTLSTTHYKETLPGSRQIPKLPRTFYFQLRRLIKELKGLEAKDRTKARDLDKALALSRDIVNIRVKKIASLGASGEQTTEVTANLTVEEQALYEKVRENVESWKKDILGRESTS